MPRFYGVRWRLAGALFAIILAIIALVGFFLLEWTESYYMRELTEDLKSESLVVGQVAWRLPPSALPETITRMGKDLKHRITVVREDGTVAADSQSDYRKMANHAGRPEIRQALQTGLGTATRHSATLHTDMLYVATSFLWGREVLGVARVAEPLSGLAEVLGLIRRTFLTTALLAAVVAAIASVKLAAGITGPMERIATVARKLAGGDLSARVPAPESPTDETGALALTFNSMAGQLQSMVEELKEQKARMQTIFDHTDDGLVLVGPHAMIQMVNPAACKLLGATAAGSTGKTVIEGTLSHDLAALVERVTRTGEPAALDISLAGKDSSVLAYVAPLGGAGTDQGALAVLHDVTAAKQLDAIRRDFVANVSHELRTPLASIKAMAETILLRYKSDPAAAPQFAQQIVNEADRMALLAEDLLDLARIESGRRALKLEDVPIAALVEDVIERLRPAAERKSIEVQCTVPDGQMIRTDREFLDQILANLVDNAIKYSRENGSVVVAAERVDDRVSISIADSGIGIPAEDLPRIFERFYRVDKARSRESGGTGLGLSIVKHLTESMGGKVTVSSQVGKGTVFTIALPADQPSD